MQREIRTSKAEQSNNVQVLSLLLGEAAKKGLMAL